MAAQRLAGFSDYRVGHIATCFYTVAAAEEFIAESRGAAWILTGFSGHGFKFAPLIGEALAEVVGGRMPADQFRRWISGRPGAMQEPVQAG
jgi:glycine/D-amino acid oxidase-like deaminating enzyme